MEEGSIGNEPARAALRPGAVAYHVPATTANLGPGFDALGLALSLDNTVEMAVAEGGGITITIQGEGEADLSRDGANLVYRAATQVFEQAGLPVPPLRIHLVNRIPLAAGLGSSAAAIVGGLCAANEIAGSPLSTDALLHLATAIEGHPDNVAPALIGGFVVATVDRNSRITHCRLEPPRDLKCVVAVPQYKLATSESRRVLPQVVSHRDAVYNVGRAALLVSALSQGKLSLLGAAMDDRLHQPYRSSLVPGMDAVFKAAKEAGAMGVALSGAGPTLIAFCAGGEDNVAQAMSQAMSWSGLESRVMILNPSLGGARLGPAYHLTRAYGSGSGSGPAAKPKGGRSSDDSAGRRSGRIAEDHA